MIGYYVCCSLRDVNYKLHHDVFFLQLSFFSGVKMIFRVSSTFYSGVRRKKLTALCVAHLKPSNLDANTQH